MHPQIRNLNRFYHQTDLGRYVQGVLLNHIRNFWPDIRGRTILGYGYACPLDSWLADSYRTVYLMPDSQGAEPWIGKRGNVVVESSDAHWPLPTSSLELCVILHGLETCSHASTLLSECWRTLAPEGVVLVIVPNRAGFWARRDSTPFGFGRPYSSSQIESLMQECRLEPISRAAALFGPPGPRATVGRMAPTIDRVARHMPIGYAAGIHLLMARKRVFSTHRSGIGETVKSKLASLQGHGIAEPGPASGRSRS
ncbi:MAG: hypothetical protein OXC91_03750 [Rhodobacteraceae bacterium]|nr:hypothetical protein [Paracoccaceae bacterium]